MIVPHLKGGLGNQLFQIAASYAHSLNVNDDFGINYNLPHNLGQGNRAIQYKYNVFSNIESTTTIPSNIYNEPDFDYNKIPLQKDILLDGYFQSEKYFKNYKDKIKQLFNFSSIKINKKYSSLKNKVVLHVRRGDYLENNDTHPSTSLDYYKKCLEQLDLKSSNILIVTDDIKNVSREFKELKYTHINGKSELEDFVYIMNADYIIGCNSSFSWWAAYLSNSNYNFFPKKWFGPAGPKNISDLYPDNFIKV
tara:strand:+ start:568 stop:1320 length:753 start_codon:yes stop_codon:yes gene_type:complete